jgi:hypothetical protein|nr:MAG TPA: hypothetical protein [Caudoviricetes sp.]
MSVIVSERLVDKDTFLHYMKEADDRFKKLVEDNLGKNIGPMDDPITLQQANGGRLLMFRCDGRTFDYDLNQWVVDEAARAPLQREEHSKFCWLRGNRALFYARSFADFFTYIDHCKRTEVAKEMLALSRDVVFYYENFGIRLPDRDKLEDMVDKLYKSLSALSFTFYHDDGDFKVNVLSVSCGDLVEERHKLDIGTTLEAGAYKMLSEYMRSKYRIEHNLFLQMLGICVLHATCVVMKFRLENSELSVVSDKTRKLTDGEMEVANFLVENYKKELATTLNKVDIISKLLSPMDGSDAPVELLELEKMCRILGGLRVGYKLK